MNHKPSASVGKTARCLGKYSLQDYKKLVLLHQKPLKRTDMKRIYSLLTALSISFGAMMLTSCDEDQMVGMTMDGSWAGNMYVSCSWNGRTYKASYSELEFSLDPFRYTAGTGYWVDYYSGAPWDYYASHIRWTVRDGVIQIYFIEDGYSMDIYDYRISNSRFQGTVYDYSGDALSFSLRRTGYSNWDDYNYGWNSWYYGYSKTGGWETRSSSADSMEIRPQRFITSQ